MNSLNAVVNSCRMKNKILVTGANGFLGRQLTTALQLQGQVICTHSSTQGDIADSRLPMDGVHHVFHLAAKSYVPDSWQDPQSFYRTNVMGTINVLDHCRQNGASLTLISSYVYGTPRCLPIAENHPLEATNPYAHTKILAEDAARFYHDQFGVPLVIVRPFNIYGPGQRDSFLIPSIVRQALDPAASAIQVKDLRPKRDYLYVDDAVSLLMATLRAGSSGVFNMGSGKSASVAEVAQLVKNAAGSDKQVVSSEEPRPGEIMDMFADTSRAASELDWKSRISLADGIAAVVAAERAVRG
jgi:nucleoside-diphosphate-sugar epimerase